MFTKVSNIHWEAGSDVMGVQLPILWTSRADSAYKITIVTHEALLQVVSMPTDEQFSNEYQVTTQNSPAV